MINTIIIDDEAKSRNTIREFLHKYCSDIHVMQEAASGEEAYGLITSLNPDLIFLDIEMPYENGLDFLKRFDRISFEIIFITAYNQYAIQAIRACALDYLLKPLSIAELKEATRRAASRIETKQSSKQYEVLVQNHKHNAKAEHHKLAVPTHDGLEFIDQKDIVVLEADGGYTNIKQAGGKKSVSTRNLKEYEDILPDTIFLRVHHSYMINLSHVRQYHKGEGGYVTMSDNSAVDISKRKKKEFMERFGM